MNRKRRIEGKNEVEIKDEEEEVVAEKRCR